MSEECPVEGCNKLFCIFDKGGRLFSRRTPYGGQFYSYEGEFEHRMRMKEELAAVRAIRRTNNQLY